MSGRSDWNELRSQRMAEPGAIEGRAVRELRERRGWSQTELADAASMTQSAVARFEAGGTVPTFPVLERLARAFDVALAVGFQARPDAA
ncbi:helix-turn-helix transcriptional regulator [Dactylosporangium sp. NPDC051484]|uniref:helix-turn-helix domain-containing protein n=1 Tax=Dactylosporangium sp. NPDC051484 TaxID=3154942 RepID=UPI00344BB49E